MEKWEHIDHKKNKQPRSHASYFIYISYMTLLPPARPKGKSALGSSLKQLLCVFGERREEDWMIIIYR